MKPITTKRIAPGKYEYTFENGLVFDIKGIGDAGSSVDRKWYYVNREDDNDGGNDHFNSKRDAFTALCEYLDHRHYVSPYGWCYVPTSVENRSHDD